MKFAGFSREAGEAASAGASAPPPAPRRHVGEGGPSTASRSTRRRSPASRRRPSTPSSRSRAITSPATPAASSKSGSAAASRRSGSTEAVAAFTAALAAAPDDAPLHRHRGHRFITERNFSKAQADLERAAALCPAGAADEWEEDGEPNAYNLPLSTKGFNIAYHLGLSRFLQADWAGALKAYDAPPMPTSLNDESAAAVAHWSWMASMRLGDRARANATLAQIHAKCARSTAARTST